MKLHKFKINELERDNGRAKYRHYLRLFWTFYNKDEKELWSGHLETIVYRKLEFAHNLFSARFHIGNAGSETPWDGHLIVLGVGFYWGHSGFRKLAEWLTRCKGYAYDSRDFVLRISDGKLWWEFANHSDMCKTHNSYEARTKKNGKRKLRKFRRGNINLSIPEMIWGPKRYSYEDVDSFETTLDFEEESYPVKITLKKMFYGRTKVDKSKHIQSYTLEVDAAKGVPTHYDSSGGWKGDRTYGWGVKFDRRNPHPDWQVDAKNAVTAWVLNERARTGFRKAQAD